MDESLTLLPAIKEMAAILIAHQWQLVTAESCTAGLIAGALTELPGSSVWFERGFVTYSNLAKQELLGVPEDVLQQEGAVSETVVRLMAEGAVKMSRATMSIAVTGIAGPDGGSVEKPVGTVWHGYHLADGRIISECHHYQGDRHQIRVQTVVTAIQRLAALLQEIR